MKASIFISVVAVLCLLGLAAFIWLLYENSKARNISPFCLRQACSNVEANQLTPGNDPEARSFVHLNYCFNNLPSPEFVAKIQTCSRGGNSKDFFAKNVTTADGPVSRIAYYSAFADWFFSAPVCGYALPYGNNPTRDGDNNTIDQGKFLDDIATCKAIVEA